MFKVYFYCILFLMTLLVGCKDNEETPAPVPKNYVIQLKFSDTENNNLLSSSKIEDLNNFVVIEGVDGDLVSTKLSFVEIETEKLLRIESVGGIDERINLINFMFIDKNINEGDEIKLSSEWINERNNMKISKLVYSDNVIKPVNSEEDYKQQYYNIKINLASVMPDRK